MLLTWLVVFVVISVLPFQITKGENVDFSKLHQNDYDLTLHIAELVYVNDCCWKDAQFGFVLYNRTTRALNASVYLLKDLGMDVTMDIQVYKFMSNEYRFFPITVHVNACEELAKNSLKSRDILRKTSNIGECPFKKGFHYITNATPDQSVFPPLIPRGQYKMAVKFFHHNIFGAEIHFYGSIKDKEFNWKL